MNVLYPAEIGHTITIFYVTLCQHPVLPDQMMFKAQDVGWAGQGGGQGDPREHRLWDETKIRPFTGLLTGGHGSGQSPATRRRKSQSQGPESRAETGMSAVNPQSCCGCLEGAFRGSLGLASDAKRTVKIAAVTEPCALTLTPLTIIGDWWALGQISNKNFGGVSQTR